MLDPRVPRFALRLEGKGGFEGVRRGGAQVPPCGQACHRDFSRSVGGGGTWASPTAQPEVYLDGRGALCEAATNGGGGRVRLPPL